MSQFWAWWDRYLFNSESLTNIKFARFLIYGLGTLFVFYKTGAPQFASEPWTPISFYQLLPGPLSNQILEICRWFWVAISMLAAVGFLFPWTATLSFLSGLVFVGYAYNLGDVYHSTHLYVMCLGLMILTVKNSSFGLKLAKLYVVFVFTYCGLQKIYYSQGFSWGLSESFYLTIFTAPLQTSFGRFVLNQPLILSQIMATVAWFGVEIFSPLALVNKRLGAVYFLVWTGFHFGVTLTLGGHTGFWSQIFCCAIFVPWDDVLNYLKQHQQKLQAPKWHRGLFGIAVILLILDLFLRNYHMDERFTIRTGFMWWSYPEQSDLFSLGGLVMGAFASFTEISSYWLIVIERVLGFSALLGAVGFLFKSCKVSTRTLWTALVAFFFLEFNYYYYFFQARYDAFLYAWFFVLMALVIRGKTSAIKFSLAVLVLLFLGPKGLYFALPLMALEFFRTSNKTKWILQVMAVLLFTGGLLYLLLPSGIERVIQSFAFQAQLGRNYGVGIERIGLVGQYFEKNILSLCVLIVGAVLGVTHWRQWLNQVLLFVMGASLSYAFIHPFFHPPMLTVPLMCGLILVVMNEITFEGERGLLAILIVTAIIQVPFSWEFFHKKYKDAFTTNNLPVAARAYTAENERSLMAFDPFLFFIRSAPCEKIWYFDRIRNEYYKAHNQFAQITLDKCELVNLAEIQKYMPEDLMKKVETQFPVQKIPYLYLRK